MAIDLSIEPEFIRVGIKRRLEKMIYPPENVSTWRRKRMLIRGNHYLVIYQYKGLWNYLYGTFNIAITDEFTDRVDIKIWNIEEKQWIHDVYDRKVITDIWRTEWEMKTNSDFRRISRMFTKRDNFP